MPRTSNYYDSLPQNAGIDSPITFIDPCKSSTGSYAFRALDNSCRLAIIFAAAQARGYSCAYRGADLLEILDDRIMHHSHRIELKTKGESLRESLPLNDPPPDTKRRS
jgi:hypothetical protein